MLRLLKWTVIGTAALGAAGYFVFGDGVVNYVTTMAASVKDGVRGQIPIEFELKRAEGLIRQIGPQIHECKREVAYAEVRLDSLHDEVAGLERAVSMAETKLKTNADVLASSEGTATFQLATGNYPRERVEADLERTFETYQNNVRLLDSKRALVKRESQALAAAQGKLDAVRAEEVRLSDLVGQLKAQKAQVDALKASSQSFVLDDSALGEAKKVLAQVKERLDVAQRMLVDDAAAHDGLPTMRTPHRDIVKEIREHFSGAAAGNDAGLRVHETGTATFAH